MTQSIGMKSVKFYCEFCGEQVRASDKVCSHCGSFFTKVRCPACSFEGDAKLFQQGCPACGYSEPENIGAATKKAKSKDRVTFTIDQVFSKKKKAFTFPFWAVWIVAGLVTGAFFVALIVQKVQQ